jgi:integrase/recombinase XerD
MMTSITLNPFLHSNTENIAICFTSNNQLNGIVKKIKDVKWSHTNKCWYLPLSRENYTAIVNAFKNKACIDNKALAAWLQKKQQLQAALPANVALPAAKKIVSSQVFHLCDKNMAALQQFVQRLILKAYSPATIKTYRNEFCQLLQTIKQKPADTLTVDELKRYMVYAMEKEGISENTAHSRLNALKFYFEQVLGREKFFWEVPRPKKTAQLPKVFSQDEIAAIIKSVINLKHKTMLMLAYSAGLRVGEVVTLKTNAIDSSRMTIFISAAKGKKDRVVALSPVLLVMLREYAKKYKPDKKGYLFAGEKQGMPYSSRSLQEVLQAAKKKAGVIRPGSIHSLRHSFATHLVDKGTDVTMIQKLLGHNDLRTTLKYLHTSNKDLLKIISPLDDLDLD